MDEAGHLNIPEAEGAWSRMEITADLHEVASGIAPPPSGRTLFKGVGLPYEDLVIAAAAIRAIA